MVALLQPKSTSNDQTIRLWDIFSYQCIRILRGHTNKVTSVTFSPDGRFLASGSYDRTIRVWDITSGKCLQIWSGHYGSVKSVAYHPNSHILASSSQDETIRLWNIQTGKGIQILRSPRLYEGMNITGVTGLTEAQIANLKALGAVEFQES
ncbi:WD40 repeat domain-containing protein [Leptodesmis sichuanensis]|uniref:WD40 repeat domain-containing protein n=1 Tax=Leptodesmis sichuanensis TaxID=2906798 RepID=UPI001F46A17E|nr:hypothetical protein [Leptodesmis sichuanensis]UIE38591.1 hypothetical protein KIK02_02830 [Leptodesmis sichuanensis A121]